VRLDKSRHVTVSENSFEDIGPHYYMVLGRPDETSSVDVLMVGYEVDDALILRNKINGAAGIGIRVENSKNIRVLDNLVSNTGEDGILFYRKTVDCECSGNTISKWGKLNNFAFIRKQHGKIFNPREYHYPHPKFPQLPLSLRDAKTWEENRYHLQGRDQSSIPEYDPLDYKGILAFRGFSAIAVTEISERIKITRNRIMGNTSRTGGLYNYASNYGINIGVASINPPTTSGDCIVTENTISGCIDFDIYSPQYVDLQSKRNVQKPSFVYGNNCDPAKVVVFGNKAKGPNLP
jgi:parallel beta-helix repeat protein